MPTKENSHRLYSGKRTLITHCNPILNTQPTYILNTQAFVYISDSCPRAVINPYLLLKFLNFQLYFKGKFASPRPSGKRTLITHCNPILNTQPTYILNTQASIYISDSCLRAVINPYFFLKFLNFRLYVKASHHRTQ
jgi:hypothetical protein